MSNSLLRDSLRQSLQDVLTEINFETDAMTMAGTSSHPAGTRSPTFGPLGLASHGSRNMNVASMSFRPSAALGITSEQLMMAAATERRLLEEKKIMMELGRARAAAAARHLVLQDAMQKRHQQGGSLLCFFQQGFGMGGMPASLPQSYASMKMNMVPQAMARPVPQAMKLQPPAEALKELGTSLRTKSAPYIDVVDAVDPDPNDTRVKKTRGGVTEPFPERLHRLLKEIANDGNGDVISFLPHGRAFAIHKPDRFVSDIMPAYFKQKSLSSFQRQLNLYGFKRVQSGLDTGAYYHELFLQGRPNMCLLMRRVGLPRGDDRRKMRSKNIQIDPDFYSLKPVASIYA